MAGEVRATPRRVLLDTNVFIIGYSDEASLEKRLLRFATTQRAELILLLSDNRKLLKAALGQPPPFQCLTPEEFLDQFAVET